ncbi:MAG: hypothetical protein ACREQW_00615 [Candidatus Binatia bacterium]
MSVSEESVLKRITELIGVGGQITDRSSVSNEVAGRVYMGTLGIAVSVYGPDSAQAVAVKDASIRVSNYNWLEHMKNGALVLEMRGMLNTIADEIRGGLLKSIRDEARGEILADFVVLAKETLDQGAKDVAAVLACAALEDALKRYAERVSIAAEGKDLSEVVNAIKASGRLSAPQGRILQSFVGVRNKAFHAEWAKIDTAEVHSVIAFVQEFVAKRFVGEDST